jgi:hypothetical protein
MRAAPEERLLWPATEEQRRAVPEEQGCKLLLKNGFYDLLLKSKRRAVHEEPRCELFLKNRLNTNSHLTCY